MLLAISQGAAFKDNRQKIYLLNWYVNIDVSKSYPLEKQDNKL